MREEGGRGLTKGLSARIVSSLPTSLLVVLGYETLKRLSLRAELIHSRHWWEPDHFRDITDISPLLLRGLWQNQPREVMVCCNHVGLQSLKFRHWNRSSSSSSEVFLQPSHDLRLPEHHDWILILWTVKKKTLFLKVSCKTPKEKSKMPFEFIAFNTRYIKEQQIRLPVNASPSQQRRSLSFVLLALLEMNVLHCEFKLMCQMIVSRGMTEL